MAQHGIAGYYVWNIHGPQLPFPALLCQGTEVEIGEPEDQYIIYQNRRKHVISYLSTTVNTTRFEVTSDQLTRAAHFPWPTIPGLKAIDQPLPLLGVSITQTLSSIR